MCGIVAYVGKHSIKNVLDGLKSIEYRGYDSFGFIYKFKKTFKIIHKVGSVSSFEAPDILSELCIGHTRWATHGSVSIQNTHPISSMHKKFFVVHNGIITNYPILKKYLEEKGFIFYTQTDTEIIANLLELLLKDFSIKKAICKLAKKIKGNNAICIYHPQENMIYGLKTGSGSLILAVNKNFTAIVSDIQAVDSSNTKFFTIDENCFICINNLGLYRVFGEKKLVALNISSPPKKQSVIENKLKHYMYQEIYEEANLKALKIPDKIYKRLSKAKNIYIIACGSSYHAAVYLSNIIQDKNVYAYYAHQFYPLIKKLTYNDIIIAISQSGETIDVITTIEQIKKEKPKTYCIAITNTIYSNLYKISDCNILLNVGTEKSVVSTKAYYQSIRIAHMLAKNKFKIVSIAIVKKLDMQAKLLANKFNKNIFIPILASDMSFSVACEFALKLKEAVYIHAEAFFAQELKHGSLALIDNKTICFAIVNDNFDVMLPSIMQVKARGGNVIIFTLNKIEVSSDILVITFASIFEFIIYFQLFTYHLSIKNNINPDRPRNLAKSVTVQ